MRTFPFSRLPYALGLGACALLACGVPASTTPPPGPEEGSVSVAKCRERIALKQEELRGMMQRSGEAARAAGLRHRLLRETLAAALAGGCSLATTAAARGVSQATVQSQLKAVFGKTGCTRQAELVALILSSPL